jgi:hypothetical protein
MRREKRKEEAERAYHAARDRLRAKRQKNSSRGVVLVTSHDESTLSDDDGSAAAEWVGNRRAVFDIRLQQLVALNSLKGEPK